MLLFIVLFGPAAWAHKVNVFAYVEEDTVYTESYFPDGKKVNGGTIEAFDSEGNKLLEGKTDIDGQFNFPAPRPGNLKIVLNASLGHRAVYTVSTDEATDMARPKAPGGVSVMNIIAGIGGILGITGIIMYILSRKKKHASA